MFGGAGKWEQQKLLKEGCEILVATPGTSHTDSQHPTQTRNHSLIPRYTNTPLTELLGIGCRTLPTSQRLASSSALRWGCPSLSVCLSVDGVAIYVLLMFRCA